MERTLKLNRWDNSLAIRIPSKILSALDLDKHSNLQVITHNDKIIIQKRLSLEKKCNLINDSVGKEW